MDQLPYEIIKLITGHLKFKEKLQLALASRSWYQALKQSDLYSEISTNEDPLALWRRIEYSQFATQVGALNWHVRDLDQPAFFKVLSSLTNLQHLSWFGDEEGEPAFLEMDASFSLHKLQSVREHGAPFSITCLLLTNNVMTNLTQLEYCQSYKGLRQVGSNMRQFYNLISVLTNAPYLQHLKLIGTMLSISMLEEIDTNASSLKTLHLSDTQLLLDKAMDPIFMRRKVNNLRCMPSTILETLIIELHMDQIVESQVLAYMWLLTSYISQKYSKLSTFEMTCDVVKYYSPGELQFYGVLIAQLLSAMAEIRHINFNMHTLNEAIIDAIEAHQPCKIDSITLHVDSETVEDQLYLLSTSNIMKNQIRSLKIISIDPDTDPTYIYARGFSSTLDSFSCLTSLDLVDEHRCAFFDICLTFVILRVAKGLKKLVVEHGFICFHEEKMEHFDKSFVLEELRIKEWTTMITNGPMDNTFASEEVVMELDNIHIFLEKVQYVIDAAPNLAIFEFTKANDIHADSYSTARLKENWILNFQKHQHLTHIYFDIGTDMCLQVENHGDATRHYIGPSHCFANMTECTTYKDVNCHFNLLLCINQHFVFVNDFLLTYRNRIYLK
ncbi:hypothetical protein EDC96DRAFT_502197 [Choanephora cucurbitarum]|nr:hypothetical protein EDC96DRAFT_502197 [Choanephora cucurbitarum]